jgi:2-polyprenyl-3-methyl-5-hydroxy-6-metoxy-1,4-benzoquinol methylase
MAVLKGQAYFDNPQIWDPIAWQGRTDDLERARLALEWLPQDVTTLLDVGCGNGIFTSQVKADQYIVGIDLSLVALKQVAAPRLQANASVIPFAETSFDICVCMEMLEHLPVSFYQNTLKELGRISSKYILISVPYNEKLSYTSVTCPICLCSFHPYNHVRQYQRAVFATLFDGHFRLVKLEAIVSKKTEAWPDMWNLFRLYKHRHGKNFPHHTVCPQCGYSTGMSGNADKMASETQLSHISIRRWWPKVTTYKWWMALYRKEA